MRMSNADAAGRGADRAPVFALLIILALSNWTELDIWQYIYAENIPIVPLYFAKKISNGVYGVANWYYLAFILVVAMLHIVNNIALPVSFAGARALSGPGVQDAVVQLVWAQRRGVLPDRRLSRDALLLPAGAR